MSLFGSIQTAANSLSASQLGIQVVGNNLANANTPGYIREEIVFQPAPAHRIGNLILGLGVQVEGIIQKIDPFLAERLRAATSDLANGEAQENTFLQLEGLLGELSDSDLSTALTNFFDSLNNVLNQPEDAALRNLAVQQGVWLTDDIRRLETSAQNVHDDLNEQIDSMAGSINRLLRNVADLNLKIVTIEGGRTSGSDGVGLRDERLQALNELASLIDIRAIEQPSGSISVFAGGDFLVLDGSFREVTSAIQTNQRGLTATEIRIADTDVVIPGASGQLSGLTSSRDEVVGEFLDELNDLSQTLIFEFNRVFSQGQGRTGYSSLTSQSVVEDINAPLDQAGLEFSPVNGSFQVQIINQQTGTTQTVDVLVELNGLDTDTSLSDLVAALNAAGGITASTTAERGISITSDSPSVEFTFSNDSSGVLAALGINTFFSGTRSGDIAVSDVLRNDPSKLATSRNGIDADTEVLAELAAFLDAPLDSENGSSMASLYDQLASTVTQGASISRAVAEGFRTFKQTLESQHLSITGVNIDEEAVKMISYQRSFQASARLITTISELLETLISL